MNHSQQTLPPPHGRLRKNVDARKGNPLFPGTRHCVLGPSCHRPGPAPTFVTAAAAPEATRLGVEARRAANPTLAWQPSTSNCRIVDDLPSSSILDGAAMQALGMAETRPRACLSTPQQPHIARAGRHTRWSKRFFSTATQHGVGHSLSLLNHHIHSRR